VKKQTKLIYKYLYVKKYRKSMILVSYSVEKCNLLTKFYSLICISAWSHIFKIIRSKKWF